MITFTVALAALIAGYFIYGKFVSRVFGVDPKRATPAYTKQDGVDYIPMPAWKIFMIQFLNIAGLGPIFGAIMGAKFGTASYLWIVLGSIFAGAVHDFLSGMISLRNDGESLPETIGRFLGSRFKQFMRIFSVLLMVLVGAVFVAGPAGLLAKLTPDSLDLTFWATVVFVYYVLATLLPIDKIIGKIYPLFAIALIFMAVGILTMLFWHHPSLPELTDGVANTHPDGLPIFPMMFVSIACGAISGFHATQSPMMARCMTSEKYGRPVFYGAMITEGIVALIWAAAATYFFHTDEGTALFAASSGNDNAAIIVNSITRDWLGTLGGLLAVLGVIAAPITSGDTAFRSARLIVADFMRLDQRPILKRLAISVPLFVAGFVILQIDFAVLWRYFAWCNQTLAVFTLWALTVYLVRERKLYAITLIPALFMTAVCSTYIFIAGEGLALSLLRAGRSGDTRRARFVPEMEKTIRATKRRSVQETRIAGEVPGKRLTEPERTPRLGIAARKKPLQMPDEGNRNEACEFSSVRRGAFEADRPDRASVHARMLFRMDRVPPARSSELCFGASAGKKVDRTIPGPQGLLLRNAVHGDGTDRHARLHGKARKPLGLPSFRRIGLPFRPGGDGRERKRTLHRDADPRPRRSGRTVSRRIPNFRHLGTVRFPADSAGYENPCRDRLPGRTGVLSKGCDRSRHGCEQANPITEPVPSATDHA